MPIKGSTYNYTCAVCTDHRKYIFESKYFAFNGFFDLSWIELNLLGQTSGTILDNKMLEE